MAAILDDGKLRLSGYVGEYYYEDGFTSSDVVLALAQVEANAPLEVHINSAGGVASEGAAIHSLLVARPGTTDIVVEGIAMSAASLIAMAGATVTMSAGAVMMIHDPENITWGNSADHAKTIEQLEALATSYARIYSDKSGKTVDECRTIMKAETWLTPEQAVTEGFADVTTEKRAEPVAAFDYRVLEKAPKRLKALAAKKDWRLPDVDKRAAPSASANRPTQEKSMTDKERADQLAAELESMKATMKSGKDADAIAKMQKELDDLRAEKDDRARRDAIKALPETKGREPQAEALCEAGNTVEQAKAVLAASPKAAEPDQFATHVDDWEARRAAGAGMQGGKPTTAATPKQAARASWGPIVEANNKRRAR